MPRTTLLLAAWVAAVALAWPSAAAEVPAVLLKPAPEDATSIAIDGKTSFAATGRTPTTVKLPSHKGTVLITGELVMPAGAGVKLAFVPTAAARETDDARSGKGAKALTNVNVQVDKGGKRIQTSKTENGWPHDPAKPVPVRLLVSDRGIEVRIGELQETRDPAGQEVSLQFALSHGAVLRNLRSKTLPSNFVQLSSWFNAGNASIAGPNAVLGKLDPASLPKGWVTSSSIPFYLSDSALPALDVSQSFTGAKEPLRNKLANYAKPKAPDRIMTAVPGDQYSALHLLAFSAGREKHVPRMTVRIGFFGAASAIMEDVVVEVPKLTEQASEFKVPIRSLPIKLADGSMGYLHHVRVSLDRTNNIREFRHLDLEFTRDLNVHIAPPDPAEFGKLPAGLPSDVVVLAATLEQSPVTLAVSSTEPGNVWFDTQKAVFKAKYTNRSSEPKGVSATATITGPGTGEEFGITPTSRDIPEFFRLEPGESRTVEFDVTPQKRGWYRCVISAGFLGHVYQRKDTTFAILAPDTRQALKDSPFGVWEFWTAHSVARRPDQIHTLATLMNKGGWRWTYGGNPSGRAGDDLTLINELRDKYKITQTLGNLPNSYQRGSGWFDEKEIKATFPAAIERTLKSHDEYIKVLHESRSSNNLLRRYSEYLGGQPYDMPADEKAKLDAQFENVKKYCAALKAINPNVKIVLFNDYPAVVFEYLKRKFPPELFDAIGLEGAMFLREPERQPDWLCVLGHHHEMRRAMKQFGYDKPLWTTEARYHATAPGALSLHQQGVIALRETMIDLQLGIQRMAAAGILKDSSDDYYWSNWGSAGFCYREPDINPKPSYAMYAWLTQVLDQAKPAGHLAVPNPSLHVVRFVKPDGSHVYGIWCVNGQQKVVFKGTVKGTIFDAYGNPTPAGDSLTLTATPTPVYVTGMKLDAVANAEPIEVKDTKEAGKLLFDFDSPDKLKVVNAANPVLEGNWDTPRIKGDFDITYGTEDGASVMKIALKPDANPHKLLPRYVQLAPEKPIVLDGRPHEFLLRVKGNAAWGRIMFELTDAHGRVFTGSGNQYEGASNSQDPHGQSFISFAGWQTMRIPIYGMYPGADQSLGWPRNYNYWPTNIPEEKAQAETVRKAQEAYDKAMAMYKTHLAEYEASVKKGVGAKKPAPPAKLRLPRNFGITGLDYPLSLTKIIVEMRPHILYLDEEIPVANPAIFIDALRVTQPPPGQ